jgi:hypothetical protein
MMETASIIDVDFITDRARILWRHASRRAGIAQVELYVKTSSRVRVSRAPDESGVQLQRVNESGHALRVMSRRSDQAGFAASSGLTESAVDWTLGAAATAVSEQPTLLPRAADIDAERFDLDAEATLPPEARLKAELVHRPFLRSIEAGTTVETLIGREGWIAVRRRHRLWGVAESPRLRLVAQRGFEHWESCLELEPRVAEASPIADRPESLTFSSEAAAPLVTALVERFHGPTDNQNPRVGSGWDVAEEPVRPDGLSGGAFDDSGFPATRRVLAERGVWVGRIAGPGTFRRGSFRDLPRESHTNLAMPSPDTKFDGGTDRCQVIHSRVVRLSFDLWVLELETALGQHWLRIDPALLLAGCSGRMGAPTLTSVGPIVPELRFDGLEFS